MNRLKPDHDESLLAGSRSFHYGPVHPPPGEGTRRPDEFFNGRSAEAGSSSARSAMFIATTTSDTQASSVGAALPGILAPTDRRQWPSEHEYMPPLRCLADRATRVATTMPLLTELWISLSNLQSQRDCVLQPRVASSELPWVSVRAILNPNGVVPAPCHRATTPLGLAATTRFSQGSSCLATLGFGAESLWDSRESSKGIGSNPSGIGQECPCSNHSASDAGTCEFGNH